MAQTLAQRRAAQRRLAKEIKTGSYKASNAGKQARETARRLREREREQRDPGFRGPPVFDDDGPPEHPGIKVRIKKKKRIIWQDTLGFTPNRSDRNVDRSSDTEEMLGIEMASEDRWNYLASQASYAEMALNKTGDAGELTMYLPFTFLFYH